jgi:predicted AlkP superfamily pyrophosphatase or phosphodiesterase
MKLRLLAALLALPFLSAPAAAQQQGRPKLIVAISVDQFSADLFREFRPHFTAGLRRLAGGTLFPAAYQGHAATETCPGHSTILTGSRPSRTGIIANNWFDLATGRADKNIYCAEDERVAGSTSENYTVSPNHLRVPALGDHMKAADPRSRVVAVSGKDRAAIMLGGHGADQRWWWGSREFTSQNRHAPTASVTAVNAYLTQALSRPRSPLVPPPLCEARSRSVPVEGGGRPVGEHRFARDANDNRAFRNSPELDGATMALGMALRQEMRLGEGPSTDLLILGLSATDFVGHYYGTGGPEMCLQLLALDRSLGDVFTVLDRTGIDYMVMLTADHGGQDIPERLRLAGEPNAARADPALDSTAMGRAIGGSLGVSGPVLFGDGASGDMYVDRVLAPATRERALAEAVQRYRAHPQVAEVFTNAQLRAAPSPSGTPDRWSLLDRARASFDPERSGDFVVLLKPRISSVFDTSRGYVSGHGSPWDYDRRVPMMFWRRGMPAIENPAPVETVDILPTLGSFLGLTIPPGSIDGRCLDIVEGPASNCAPR